MLAVTSPSVRQYVTLQASSLSGTFPPNLAEIAYLSTHTVCRYKIQLLFILIIFGGICHIGKWIPENTIFMQFPCCFKLSKNTEKLSNEQPTHAIAKCTLTGLAAFGMMTKMLRLVVEQEGDRVERGGGGGGGKGRDTAIG